MNPPDHVWWWRMAWFAAVVVTAVAGTVAAGWLLWPPGDGVRLPVLALFSVLFARIAVGFWTAVAGTVIVLARRDPLTLSPHAPLRGSRARPLGIRTALVIPAHREDPERIAAGIRAMAGSLRATGEAGAFEFFVLSDTPDEPAAARERRIIADVAVGPGSGPAVHFRWRAHNAGRKSGNIAEFCRRWGGRYECMVVLDADSRMSGETLVHLARTMEADPSLGLVQTVPLPTRQTTVFGRMQQFAAALHAPLMAAGQAFWQGDAGNYWGHNAIVRLRAFASHCGLPRLDGEPPLGGDILSHDFVEAALLRRAGWRVVLDPWAGGSFEEMPGDLVGYGRRDRRWAQGNLQHLRLLRAPGLHPLSRLHFLLGAGAYLSGLLWLLLMAAGLGLAAGGAEVAGGRHSVAAGLLTATVLFLLGPRLLGLGVALLRRRQAFGGAVRLSLAGFTEIAFAALLAPVLMTWHAGFVLSILARRAVGWPAQARAGQRVPWRRAWSAGLPVTVVGMLLVVCGVAIGPLALAWLLPVLPGMLFAIPLVRITSAGLGAYWADCLAPPFERAPPAVLCQSDRHDGAAVASLPRRAATLPRECPLRMPAQPLGPAASG